MFQFRTREFLIVLAIAASISPSAPVLGQSRGKRAPKPAKQSVKDSEAFVEVARKAEEARTAGRLDEALTLFEKGLKLNPAWKEGRWYLATILYDRDRYSEARDSFRMLSAADPKNGPVAVMLGLCEFETREFEQSLNDLQRGEELGLGENKDLIAAASYHTGILLARVGRFEEAYESLMPLARQDNQSPSIIEAFGLATLRLPFLPAEIPPDKRELVLMAGRGTFGMATHHPAEAQRAFDDLIARYPGTPNVHYAYGVFLLTDQSDAALKEFQRELEISPDHLAATLQIAFEYIKRAEYEAALPYAENAVKISPNQFATHNALGRVLVETGHLERAITELELGARQAPDSPAMHFALAHAYSKAGRKADAARERATFLKLDAEVRSRREGSQSVGGTEAKPKPDDKQP
jgi:tetratricopeptide (TPR) repeat protein